MPVDTQTKRRSVSGYSNHVIAPVADTAISDTDREHVAWLYSGIPAGTPAPIGDNLPYQGDTTIYDLSGATGSISGGSVLAGDVIYDQSGATGSIAGATTLPPETQL